MATKRFVGASQAVSQVTTVAVTAFDAGTTYRLTINNKVISVAGVTSTTATAAALAAAWNASDVPETAEAVATSDGATLTLTGDTEGKPFTVASSVVGGTGTIGAATEATAASGPDHWAGAANWSPSGVPATGVNEVQLVDLASGSANGGTFTLTYDSQTTTALDWDATAAEVKAALEALSNVGPDEVSVTGTDITSTGYEVTFDNGLGYQGVAEMTIDDNLLTGTSPVGQVTTTTPGSAGDDVILDLDLPILYGLDQSAVVLNSLTLKGRFGESEGVLGLKQRNGDGEEYPEYRGQYLQIGAVTLVVDCPSDRVKIDLGAVICTALVVQTGAGEEGTPALWLKGSNVHNDLDVRGGTLGLAYVGGEALALADLDVAGDSALVCGSGCTLATVDFGGAALELNSSVTTLTVTAGEVVVEAGAVTTLNLRGGVVAYNSTGTLTTAVVSDGGVLDFSRDPRPKVVANPVELYSTSSQVLDPNKVVASLIVDFNEEASEGQVVWGRNCRLTRGAVS